MSKEKTIVQKHSQNFETLKEAFIKGNVCLMDCIENSTGDHVAVICAMNKVGDEIEMVPFAKFFNGNPYGLLTSPMDYEEA